MFIEINNHNVAIGDKLWAFSPIRSFVPEKLI